jgi:hypothetical protein
MRSIAYHHKREQIISAATLSILFIPQLKFVGSTLPTFLCFNVCAVFVSDSSANTGGSLSHVRYCHLCCFGKLTLDFFLD